MTPLAGHDAEASAFLLECALITTCAEQDGVRVCVWWWGGGGDCTVRWVPRYIHYSMDSTVAATSAWHHGVRSKQTLYCLQVLLY